MILKNLTFVFILLISWDTLGQSRDTTIVNPGDKDIIDFVRKVVHLKTKSDTTKKGTVYYSIMPSSSSNISGKSLIVSSINAAFYLGDPKSTYLSSIYFVPYTNFGQQYGFMSTLNLWSDRNLWNWPGEFKIQKLNPYSYGLGSNASSDKKFTIDYDYIRLYVTANRRLRKYIYGGIGLNIDRYYNVHLNSDATQPNPFLDYNIGTTSSSTSTGITFDLLFDNRRNSINPDKGFYSTIVYRLNPQFLGNSNVWGSLYLDARKYFPLHTQRRNIIAVWAFYWTSFGDVPYLNLPGTGMEYNERSGRGYSLGRFRGRQMIYLEGEYRFTISQNGFWGGVLFANLQSLEEPDTNQFQNVNPAIGFGARMKFNKSSNTNLDLDFGFGKESFNFYINLGELF